jgi:hypothetical protein
MTWLRNRFGRRRDSERLQLLSAAFAQPFTRPRRRQNFLNDGVAVPCFVQRCANRVSNYISRRATRISGRQTNVQHAVWSTMRITHDPQLDNAQDGDLRIQHALEYAPYRAIIDSLLNGDYHCAPG